MKEDFALAKEELSRIGIVRIATDFYLTPQHRGVNFFVKSPATNDKTWSCALYQNGNRFCDFANGNISGDCIAFVAYVRGCNQWEALKMLKTFYGLSDSQEKNKADIQRKIILQQHQNYKRQERRCEFKRALFEQIETFKSWSLICRLALEKCLYEPLSDMWAYCIEEQQKTNYQLDILCASNQKKYVRMKPNVELGLPSDRYQWILDVLEILAEQEAFTATVEEIREIEAQRDFELQRRPGVDRRCSVEW